jgi:ABC-type ATPase with predicted acetyltransferase domain
MNEECWECSECGGCVTSPRPPAVCPECGTGGAIFVLADRELDDQPEQRWLREGLEMDEYRQP